jgi:hypothetical protein
MPAYFIMHWEDFVGTFLRKQGLGTIFVAGADAAGNPDTTAKIDGQSRIWTFQPGSQGKVSLGLPAVAVTDEIGSLRGNAIGLEQDGSARANVGIVNLDSIGHTWTVSIIGDNGTQDFNVSVLPYSMVQTAAPSGNFGYGFLSLVTRDFGFWWSGYGVSVDNTTGDGWVSHVVQQF